MKTLNHTVDRDKAILWARELMGRKDWLILDTETTGLKDAEICQIGILSPSGLNVIKLLAAWTLSTEQSFEAEPALFETEALVAHAQNGHGA
jgi:DNA polymerase III epsilon subunit-like protein